MAESGGDRVCYGEKEDRLSALPTHLKEDILGYMPFSDAIRTSVLSSEWSRTWTGMRKLVFDKSFWRLGRITRQSEAVNHFFIAHKGPVREFYLDTDSLDSNQDIGFWLLSLSKKGVEVVVIDGDYRFHPRLFSSRSFFECLKLKELRLSHCTLIYGYLSGIRGFPNLVTLDLKLLDIDTQLLTDIIHLCPLLETLILDHTFHYSCEWRPVAVVNSRSLKMLHLNYIDLGTLSLENIPNLTCIKLWGCPSYDGPDRFWKFMNSLFGIKELSCQFIYLERLKGNCPTCLPTPLESLNKMSLVGVNMYRLNDVLLALCLIRSSPKLQCLSIYLTWTSDKCSDAESSQRLLESQTREHNIISSNVSIVWIHGITGSIESIMLVKVILLCCPNLETLYIVPRYQVAQEALMDITSALIRCRLYSDKVQFLPKSEAIKPNGFSSRISDSI